MWPLDFHIKKRMVSAETMYMRKYGITIVAGILSENYLLQGPLNSGKYYSARFSRTCHRGTCQSKVFTFSCGVSNMQAPRYLLLPLCNGVLNSSITYPVWTPLEKGCAHTVHTTYSWNIMCQKWEGDCGLWVLNEIIKKIYTESLKKIVGAVWELPAK